MKYLSVFLLAVLVVPKAFAVEIKIAAASDLKFAMDQIIRQYETAHPEQKVSPTYGASGKFATQIKEGAPFDIFFSADTEKADDVAKAGKTSGEAFAYAHGHVVLWARNESTLKLDGAMKCLLDPSIKKIAIANPATAPYGTIAEQALKKTGLYEKVSAKLVVGENIAQTAQFVESSAADVGLIAKSLALSPTLKKEGHFVEVDASLYPPLTQSGILLKSANLEAAKKFREYFLSSEGKKIMTSFGLSL